jgi:hypothetical protein
MSTYSAPFTPPIESDKLGSILAVLQQLPDNTNKLIAPHDVRDAVFTLWENTIFKQFTGSASVEYIGIDNVNTRNQVFFGKRQYLGSDIMNSNLLTYNSPDTLPGYYSDFYFYNNKSDGFGTQDTRISILAGTDSTLNNYAPFLNVSRTPGYLDLDIVNPSLSGGNLFLTSETGNVSINDIVFPTVAETGSSASDGRILRYRTSPTPRMYWEDVSFSSDVLGSTGSQTDIYGSPVNLNGYPLEFTDATPMVQDFGGIVTGRTFSNYPIVELLRELLYPFLGPLATAAISPSVIEYNQFSNNNMTMSYTITKRSENIIASTGSSTPTASPLSNFATASGSGIVNVSGNVSWSVASLDQNLYPSTNLFKLTVTDSTFITYTASAIGKFVVPYFYGFHSLLPTDFGWTADSTAAYLYSIGGFSISAAGDKNITLNGSGYIYFCYDANYGPLSSIKDNNGFTLSFTTNIYSVNSPTGKWTTKNYRFYYFPTPTTLTGQVYQFNL